MSEQIKVIIAIGGTGGHVFPGCNLANYLVEKKYNVKLVTDTRGFRFLKEFTNFNISILPSMPLKTKNIFKFFLSFSLILYSVVRSVIFLLVSRPSIIFGMGGYASFPICIAASLLRIKFVIYENNFVIGKANKYLLPFANKILVSNDELEGIPEKYKEKIVLIGNIIKKEIINFTNMSVEKNDKRLSILVLGGSQAAKIFAEILPNIFSQCLNEGIQLKIIQHCLPSQNDMLKKFYENINLDFEIFNFSNNLIEYFSKVNLAITRSGSSMLAELTNANIPFISVPLPSSADNHQLKNAIYYEKNGYSYLIEEKFLNKELFGLIKNINANKSILNKISAKQGQHSDKSVYENIDKVIKSLNNEKY